jgi:hypothetical protein
MSNDQTPQVGQPMAESRQITWNIKLKIANDVTTRFPINLKSQDLEHGKMVVEPPSQLSVPVGRSEANFSFKSTGRSFSLRGTEGLVIYAAGDNPTSPTQFDFFWAVPYNKANEGNVSMNSITNYFLLDNGGGVPKEGHDVTVNVTITQVGPTI